MRGAAGGPQVVAGESPAPAALTAMYFRSFPPVVCSGRAVELGAGGLGPVVCGLGLREGLRPGGHHCKNQ